MKKRLIYKYSSIIRILDFEKNCPSYSKMIDFDTSNNQILSSFDASNEFDANFITSFINLTSNCKTGFICIENDPEIARIADAVMRNHDNQAK